MELRRDVPMGARDVWYHDAAAAVGLISLLTALLTLVFTWPTRRRRERTADQRSAFESTRLRWAREEDAQLR